MNEPKDLKESPEQTKPLSRKRKVLSVFFWIAAWPIIIGFVGLVIAVTAGNTFVNVTNMNSPQGYQIRAMWAAYVGILVLVCYFFMWRKSRGSKPTKRISVNVLRAYMWIGIFLGVAITAIIPDPDISSANAGINVQQTNALFKPDLQSDAAIIESLARVGATDTEWVETKFVAGYDDTILDGQAGSYQAFVDTAGNWSYGILTIKEGIAGNALDSVVAHEYLHHVWFKALDEDTKTKLTSDLITLYSKDTAMHERVQSYAERQTLQPTELFSYYCTESSDGYLTDYVLSECMKYINRGSLVFIR